MIIFRFWSLISTCFLLFLAWRTKKFAQHLTLLSNLPMGDPSTWPKMSLVIPACNEADTIEAAGQSLLNLDYPNLEIIFVNDRSDDQTRQIVDLLSLRDERIKAVHVNYLPDGWLGKVNALERGISMTSSPWVLITDADVHFAPDALKRAITHVLKNKIDFMTVIPNVVSKSPVLQVVMAQLFHQASLFFRADRLNDPRHRACYGQGAFLLFNKSVYTRSQKMEWLKMEVVDDTGFALMMRRAGAKMAAVSGKDKVWLEWYPSLQGFIRGIEKNAFAFSQYSLRILLGFTASLYAVVFGFTVAPFLAGSVLWPAAAGLALGLYLLAIQNQLQKILHLEWWTVLMLPVASLILPLLFLRASLVTLKRGGVNWRGTFYDLDDLKTNQRMKLANLVFSNEPPPSDTHLNNPPRNTETELT